MNLQFHIFYFYKYKLYQTCWLGNWQSTDVMLPAYPTISLRTAISTSAGIRPDIIDTSSYRPSQHNGDQYRHTSTFNWPTYPGLIQQQSLGSAEEASPVSQTLKTYLYRPRSDDMTKPITWTLWNLNLCMADPNFLHSSQHSLAVSGSSNPTHTNNLPLQRNVFFHLQFK